MSGRGQIGRDELRQVTIRLDAAEKSLPALEHNMWQMLQSKELTVENPSLVRVPLQQARCIVCDRKAELMGVRPGPWDKGGMPNRLSFEREPACPAHPAAGPPRGYRQR